ncbi:MAG: DnaA regulatory inactivator Hda [Rhodocyclaceae bacterium]|nr:DnaA regulatory inactivator Hda [Rhodocyclaceae bacterium]
MSQLLLDLKPDVPPTFANFVTGRNGEACRALQALSVSDGFQSIYLWGPTGSGKTHLLNACVSLQCNRRAIHQLSAGKLASPESIAPRSMVLIDQVESLGEADQTTLFRLFNTARHSALAIVVTANVPPLNLSLREDLRTRLGQALVFHLQSLSDDEKRTALLQHSQQRGMRLDESVLNYLMHHGRRDLPALMNVLDQLDQVSLEQKRHPTLPLLRELLQSPLNLTPP